MLADVQLAPSVLAVSAQEERFRTWLQVLGVLATVITIVLALFLQWGLARLRRPRLSLEWDEALDGEDWVCLDFPERIELYLRLKVVNEPKRDTAHHTEVLLLRVQRPPNVRAPVVPSRQLAWADTPAERLAIPAGTWRRVDVLKLTVTTASQASALVPALKVYEPTVSTARRWRVRGTQRQFATEREVLREAGGYEFHLAVTADEIEASRWVLSFRYVPAHAEQASQLLSQLDGVELRRQR